MQVQNSDPKNGTYYKQTPQGARWFMCLVAVKQAITLGIGAVTGLLSRPTVSPSRESDIRGTAGRCGTGIACFIATFLILAGGAAADTIYFTETNSFTQTSPVGNNGPTTIQAFTFTPNISLGTLTNTAVSISTTATFTGYSYFPSAATSVGGYVGASTTTLSYDLSSYGLYASSLTGSELIPCASVCGPGTSPTVTFVSGTQNSDLSTSSPNASGGSISASVLNTQASIDGATTVGTTTITGTATVARTVNVAPASHVSPTQPPGKPAFDRAMAHAFAAIGLTLATASRTGCAPCAGLAVLSGDLYYIWNLGDPADSNYTKVATPPQSMPVAVSGWPFLSQNADNVADNLYQNMNLLDGILNAAQTSNNRATGAYDDGQYDYEALQLEALAYYYQEEQTLTLGIGTELEELSTYPVMSGVSSDFSAGLYSAGAEIEAADSPAPEPTFLPLLIIIGLLGAFAAKRRIHAAV